MKSSVPPQVAGKKKSERRIAPRFQPAYGTVYRLGAAAGASGACVGLVWNISETGVSMLVGKPPSAGAKLHGELTSEAASSALAIPVLIVHVRKIETGDYFVGAQFERPLHAEEIKLFMVPQNAPAAEANGKAKKKA